MKRLARVLILVGLTAVLLEVALQILSLGAWWWFGDTTQQHREGSRVVMCLGDSFTFGCGAAAPDGAYPAVLERALRDELGGEWEVVNHGYPGRNSRQVLSRLDGYLASRPEFVCVVIGVNDGWSQPEELTLPPFDPSTPAAPATAGREPFRWEWRTLRLLSTLRALNPFAIRDAPPGEDREHEPGASLPQSLLGEWQLQGSTAELALHDGGEAVFRGMPIEWRVDGAAIEFFDGAAVTISGKWHLADNRLSIVLADGSQTLVFARAATGEPASVLDHVRAAGVAISAGDGARALLLLQRALPGVEPGSAAQVEILAQLVRVNFGLGERAQAESWVRELQQLHQRDPAEHVWSAYAQALHAAGHVADAEAEARRLLAAFPNALAGWSIIVECAYQSGRLAEAQAAADRALELAADQGANPVFLLRRKVDLWADENPRIATGALVQMYTRQRDDHAVVQLFQIHHKKLTREVLEQCCDAAELSAEDRDTLLRLQAGALEAGGAQSRVTVLGSHLKQLVQHCRAAGATVIFGTYPWGDYSTAMTEVADAMAVEVVPVHREIEAFARAHPGTELFVPDGHCNDAGYRIMGEAMARAVIDAVRQNAAGR